MIIRKTILILALLGITQIRTLHHDSLDGFVANEHIDWTDASDDLKTSGAFYLTTAKTPSSTTDTGTAGQIAWDASYIYVCTATNNWERTAIATWGVAVYMIISEVGDILISEAGDTLIAEGV